MLDLLVWMATRLLSGLGQAALILWAFVSGLWLGMRQEWNELDRHLRDPSPFVSDNGSNALQDHPASASLQSGDAPAKMTSEENGKNVIVLAQRQNR